MHNNSEKGTASAADVIPNVARFLEEAAFQDEIRQLPLTLQEMFEDILDSDSGNDLDYRRRILASLKLCQSFASTLDPFSNLQIIEACKIYLGHE